MRNWASFVIDVTEAIFFSFFFHFLEGHLFEFTDHLWYLWAGEVNEHHPPERRRGRQETEREIDRYKRPRPLELNVPVHLRAY